MKFLNIIFALFALNGCMNANQKIVYSENPNKTSAVNKPAPDNRPQLNEPNKYGYLHEKEFMNKDTQKRTFNETQALGGVVSKKADHITPKARTMGDGLREKIGGGNPAFKHQF